ncbi:MULTISPECIES: phosphoglycolate phosphatase [Methylobacterium]|uniref:Phosphoglycolate phosphatase n=1 Tax=Methylobacterium thuringiense TaxID=1003091 RepID=A0ABQ4TN96_9HYPH|nr:MULTISPECIES: phosphoglycolate phosphatase [Methylobacterium]TXN21559.1 phosphoglycolate phosphatase [Methylobacterium sp. WL9]GJE56456.1 N-acetylmuramic acid 6-phosphate phosphatase [Methylobacterium thuringiense]
MSSTLKTSSTLKKIAVFDLDGTLADTAGDLIGTLNVILDREGLAALPLEQARDLLGAGARALIQRGFSAAGETLEPARLERLFQDFLEHYGAHLAERSRLYPGVATALDRLEAEGFLLAVCTNKVERHAVDLLGALGLGHRFAAIVGKDTFAYSKPDPRHITGTVERAGGDPARAVMVGDSRADVDAAKAAGIPVVGVSFGYTAIPMRDLAPDRIIDHFDALPAAVADLVPA